MATTTNLGLFLPQSNDYVNVKRDLEENFQKIDDAFTIEDITSTLTINTGVTLQCGSVFKIGKLVIVQLRFSTDGSNIVYLIDGFPIPNIVARSGIRSNVVPLATNYSDQVMFVSIEGKLQHSTQSPTITSSQTMQVCGAYICE